jgi:hypothetical protein
MVCHFVTLSYNQTKLVTAILLSVSPRKATRPLTAILCMELLSRQLRRTPSPSSSLERAEYARRDRDILWYALRGPIWDDYTRYAFHYLRPHVAHPFQAESIRDCIAIDGYTCDRCIGLDCTRLATPHRRVLLL